MSVAVEEGQYVRVVLEGVVLQAGQEYGSDYFTVGAPFAKSNSIRPDLKHVKSVEVIPEPEAWQYGDVVVDAEGDVFKRIDPGVLDRAFDGNAGDSMLPWRSLSGRNMQEYYPTRPLTLIVRGNKAVSGSLKENA